jgi:hypothetical protein
MNRRLKAASTIFALSLTTLLLAGCGSDVKDATKSDANAKSSVVTGKPADTPTTKPESQPELEIVSNGFTQLPPDSIGSSYLTYAIVVRNNSKKKMIESASLNVAFYDAANTVVKSESPSLSYILPGQTVAEGSGLVQASGVTRMEVQALVERTSSVDGPIGSVTAEGINTVSQQYLGLKTNCTLKGTFSKDLKDLEVTAVYYNAAGQIVGGASTFAEFLPANGQVAVEISGAGEIPAPAKTEVYGSISNLTALGLVGN